MQANYNRQPFPDGTTPADIRTHEEILLEKCGPAFADLNPETITDLNRDTVIKIQNDYDAQFDDTGIE